MAGAPEQKHPNLNLSPEERRLFGQVFSAADSDNLGVVTGDVALNFFPGKTKLPSEVLGEIWQIADTEDKGFLTPAGFGIILRLIGYAQAGRPVSAELALKPGGPLPRFEGINMPSSNPPPPASPTTQPLQAQSSGGPIRVPPLQPDKANQYAQLFEESGAQDGLLSGVSAKQIFDRAQLPNDVLIRIWNLSDTEQRGMLSITEFIIAMHLLASFKIGAMRALPQTLPPGLYEAAARRGAPLRQQTTGSRPTSDVPPGGGIPRQFTGNGPVRTSSPLARPPQVAQLQTGPASSSSNWAVTPAEKSQFDTIFARVDTGSRGVITGEQAVGFFSNSRLPEEDLEKVWDLADINAEGQLNRDEFAVAMHLIRLQLGRGNGPSRIPDKLPPNLIPPSMRRQSLPVENAFAPAAPAAPSKPKSASDDLFGLDAFTSTPTPAPAPAAPPQIAQSTGGSSSPFTPMSPQTTGATAQSRPPAQQMPASSVFKPFIPSSSFGQSIITPQSTGQTNVSSPGPNTNRGFQPPKQQSPAEDDLLGDTDPEINKRLTQETTELANLSNQVGSLTNQMQQVKSKRASTEQDLTQVNSKKRDFENRLAQLRTAYEQEARDVKTLEDRLAASKNEIQKLQSDMLQIQKNHQELKTHHQQAAQALDADKGEHANLKETMRQLTAEVNQLKPQLEKMRSDARQQKGLVAINRKQMSTIESEREKLKAELEAAAREHADAAREAAETQKSLEALKNEPMPQAPQITHTSSPPVASPAASVTSPSTNPFFRRTATGTSDRGLSPSPFAPPQNAASPNYNAFDSFFAPSFATANTESPAPPAASLGTEHTPAPAEERKVSDAPQPTTSTDTVGESTASDSPEPVQVAEHAPPPPQSRQITSSALPLAKNIPRSDSPSSSVGVVAPSSRYGDDSGAATPSRQPSQAFTPAGSSAVPDRTMSFGPALSNSRTASPLPNRKSSMTSESREIGPPSISEPHGGDGFSEFGQPSVNPNIPGSFPGDFTTASQTPRAEPSAVAPPFSNESSKAPTNAKEDFDAAFAGFGNQSKPTTSAPMTSFGGPSPAQRPNEFPPIQELGSDDDSESEEEDGGFDDNFTSRSPASKGKAVETNGFDDAPPVGVASPGASMENVPDPDEKPPTPGAQSAPPTYDQMLSSEPQSIQRKGSNSFPMQYMGLLPSREGQSSPMPMPMQSPPEAAVRSPEGAPWSPSNGDFFMPSDKGKERAFSGTSAISGGSLPASHMPMAPGATNAAPYAYTQAPVLSQNATPVQSPPPMQNEPPSQPSPTAMAQPTPTAVPASKAFSFDDFDNEFGDLSEAKEADDLPNEEHHTGGSHSAYDEFNPNFDSPAPSQRTFTQGSPAPSTLNQSFHTSNNSNAFQDFEANFVPPPGAQAPPPGAQFPPPQPQQQGSSIGNNNSNHDWDAMFAGLGDGGAVPTSNGANQNGSHGIGGAGGGGGGGSSLGPQQAQQGKPGLSRAISGGTEHDDPILKELTSMGYSRNESLAALEKYDYNIDKVRISTSFLNHLCT
ncbi:hypothetical protein MMC25_007896 [Agyrium rufum]|nr:hypothetical protein [Agyrium rufum]